MKTPLADLVDETGLKRIAIAARLGILPNTLSTKLMGKRPFSLDEAQMLVALLSRHLGRTVRVEDVQWPTVESSSGEPAAIEQEG